MKSRKFRRKAVEAGAEGDGENGTATISPAPVAAKAKEKKRPDTGRVLLSFGDDEETHGAVVVKKAGKLRPSGAHSTALPSTDAKPATQVSAAGDDDALTAH